MDYRIIELPSGYAVSSIYTNSIRLNDLVLAESRPAEIGNYDNDRIQDLMVKFNRQAVENLVSAGGEFKITITGQLNDGKKFAGNDTIQVR